MPNVRSSKNSVFLFLFSDTFSLYIHARFATQYNVTYHFLFQSNLSGAVHYELKISSSHPLMPEIIHLNANECMFIRINISPIVSIINRARLDKLEVLEAIRCAVSPTSACKILM